MPHFVIRWEIDIFDANSPEEAALKALEIQRDPEGQATYFSVAEVNEDTTLAPFVGIDVEYVSAP